MSESTARTMDPFYIDVNLVSSTDLLQKVTDYTDLLIKNPTNTAINSMYWHTNAHSDPVTSKIDFYKNLHDGTLSVKENTDGVKKERVVDTDIVNKNIRDQLPENIHVKTSDSSKYGDPEMESETVVKGEIRTRTKTWVSTKTDPMISTPGKWQIESNTTDVKAQIEPLPEANTQELEIKEQSGLKDMDAWQTLWWIEKLNTTHEIVKQSLLETLGDGNEYYTEFSESVGQLKNVDDYVYDSSTTPVWDTSDEGEFAFGETSIPKILPSIAVYNTSAESRSLSRIMSKKNTILYRKNMINVMEDASADIVRTKCVGVSTSPHGNNLVCDSIHPSRMVARAGDVIEIIQNHLKGLYKILEMFSNKENYSTVGKPRVVMMKVEKTTQAIDRLKRKVFAAPTGAYTFSEILPPGYFGIPGKYTARQNNDEYLK